MPRWERTRHFRVYSSKIIPGPLQTRAYITAILSALMRRRGLRDDVEEAVQVRVDKQHVIHEGDHRFAVVLEESVLRAPIGGADVMAGQLGHLLTVSALPSISLGIIPSTPTGPPCGLRRGSSCLTTPRSPSNSSPAT